VDSEAEIILYGSRARGEAGPESDWDILILINQEKQTREIENKYRDQILEIELEFGQSISSIIINKDDWEGKYSITPLYENIKNEGLKIN
jgi:predicted nucleotidyltransferase